MQIEQHSYFCSFDNSSSLRIYHRLQCGDGQWEGGGGLGGGGQRGGNGDICNSVNHKNKKNLKKNLSCRLWPGSSAGLQPRLQV